MVPSHVTTTIKWPATENYDVILQSISLSGTLSASATPPSDWIQLLDTSIGDTDDTYIRIIALWKRCVDNEPMPVWTDIVGDSFIINQQVRGCAEEGNPLSNNAIEIALTLFQQSMIDEAPINNLYMERLGVLLFGQLIGGQS